MIVTSMLFVILRFCVLFRSFAFVLCQSDTIGSILNDHAQYVILLVKVKIVLNSSSNLKLQRTTISTFLQFLIALTLIFFYTNHCGMIPWFS